MVSSPALLLLLTPLVVLASPAPTAAPSVVTVQKSFPLSAFKSYYDGFSPSQTSAQVQPVVSDPVNGRIYELDLSSSQTIPGNDTFGPINWPNPSVKNASLTASWAISKISALIDSADNSTTPCQKCVKGLEIASLVAKSNPWEIEDLATELCIKYAFASVSGCRNVYTRFTYAPILAQVLTYANVTGNDGILLCQNFITKSKCPYPAAAPLDLDAWFSKPRPENATVPKASGKRLQVLHLSDMHIDPRYLTSSEASCSSGLCCRKGGFNTASPNATVFPAPNFGAFTCDSPIALVAATLEAIPVLTGTSKRNPFAFSIMTGDMVSHDAANTLSRSWIEYSEVLLFGLIKKFVEVGAMYVAMGNHDQFQQAQDAPHAIQPEVPIADQLSSWNYDHLARLWAHEGWLPEDVAKESVSHYAAYSTLNKAGLRIITLNTDLWYRANFYNYINSDHPDTSGMLRFLTDELQKAEDSGERVWIVGHVLPGWDGTNPMNNPTNLYYQIIDRYSPHVVAATFFGHIHEDAFSIMYKNNGTAQNEDTAVNVAWMSPSVVPLTNLNSGFRTYEIDSASFEIYEAKTFFANVSTFTSLDAGGKTGPVFELEYSTRTAYDPDSTWPSDAPLNASFFHRITENMEKDHSLVELFTTHQGKKSSRTPFIQSCNTTECVEAKICYMRSGSTALAKSNCIAGYGSVQS